MSLLYRLAADAMVVIHMSYVLFVIVGFLLTVLGTIFRWQWIRNAWFRVAHLTMILIVVFEAWLGITCPLTTWEQQLRASAGQETYKGAFVANLVHVCCSMTCSRGCSCSGTRCLALPCC